MASIIRIKRSGVTAVPEAGLASGELAYSWATAAGGKLYIGSGVEDTPGIANSVVAVGGLYYTDLVTNRISHTPGELTANSALIVDTNSTIDHIKVDNLDLNDSTLSSISLDSNIIIDPNGAGKTVISNIYVDDDATSLSAYIESVAGGAIIAGAGLLSTPGAGAEAGSTILSVRVDDSTIEIKGAGDDILQVKDSGITNIKLENSSISVAVDGAGTPGTVSLGGTLSILGSDAINTTLSGSTVTVSVDTATTTTLGVAKFATADFGVSVAGEVTLDSSVIKSITTDSVGGALASTTNAISILGGTAIGVTHSGSEITVAADIATTSAVGVASFNSTEFTVSGTGEVVLATGGIANGKLDNSSIIFGTAEVFLGDTVTALAITTIEASSIKITDNDITSTAGDINITPLAGNDVSITASGLGNIGLSVASGQEITLSTLAVTDLTANRLVVAGTAGALETNSNLTYDGTTLTLTGNLDVDNIRITDNTISSTTGDVVISPFDTGTVNVSDSRIINVLDPIDPKDATNKQYVDAVAQGLKILPQALALSDIDLSATYDNGTAGAGATLTSTSNVTFPDVDGIAIALNDNVILNGQTNKAHNGSYILTTVGSAGTPWVLTRAPFIDQASEMEGSFEFVTSGNNFGNTGWVLTSLTEPVVVGTTELLWVQFSGAGTYTAGVGITLTGTEFTAKVDGTSIAINVSDQIEVKDAGITNVKIADGTIENVKLADSVINITGSDASTDAISLGETITFAVGNGIATAVTANTLTISGVDATDTVKGIAKFDVTDFTVATGDVTLKVQRIHDIVDGLVAEGQAMTITYDDPAGSLTFAANTATTSALGVAKFNSTNFAVSSGEGGGDVTIIAIDGGTF